VTLTAKGFAGGPMADIDFGFIANAGLYVEGANDLQVTQPSSGTRSVRVATGSSDGYGVRVINDAVIDQVLAPPIAGVQWYMLALRRDWAAKTCTLVVLSGSNPSSSALPSTSVGLSLPATIASGPGTQVDQPLAWVAVSQATTVVAIFDLRMRLVLDQLVAPNAEALWWLKQRAITAPVNGVLAACTGDNITYRYDFPTGKWFPWDSADIAYTATWGGMPVSSQEGVYRYTGGKVRAEGIATASGGTTAGVFTTLPPAAPARQDTKQSGWWATGRANLFAAGDYDVVVGFVSNSPGAIRFGIASQSSRLIDQLGTGSAPAISSGSSVRFVLEYTPAVPSF
jgi:hypothetical protein